MKFFVGLDSPAMAKHFDYSFISVNRLKKRKGHFSVNKWIMDSGAFTQISQHGEFIITIKEYATQVNRWRDCGSLLKAVSQDYMCEAFILDITGNTVEDHQILTIERYDELYDLCGEIIMPVLQGYSVIDYQDHVLQYGERLKFGAWVGVGSVCKRNSSPTEVVQILRGIRHLRPDLNLHGFGLKKTALQLASVRDLLFSADSMAWSYAARMEKRNQYDWREAKKFEDTINNQMIQERLL